MDNITSQYNNVKQQTKKSTYKPQQQQIISGSEDMRHQLLMMKLSSQKQTAINENRPPHQIENTHLKQENYQHFNMGHKTSPLAYYQAKENNAPSYPPRIYSNEHKIETDNKPLPARDYFSKPQGQISQDTSSKSSMKVHSSRMSIQPIIASPKHQQQAIAEHQQIIPTYEVLLQNQQTLEMINQMESRRNYTIGGPSQQQPLQVHSSYNSINDGNSDIPHHSKSQKQANATGTGKKSGSHKKSQSLFNQKIVDIIAGLQQSLGVISNNVKNSFNNNDEFTNRIGGNNNAQQQTNTNQKQSLIESAMLAQKLAKITSEISHQAITMGRLSEDPLLPKKKTSQRKPSASKSNKNNQHVIHNGFKTVEEPHNQYEGFGNRSNRGSIDFKTSIKINSNSKDNGSHQRTRSDLQHSRKSCYGGYGVSAKVIGSGAGHHNNNKQHQTLLTCSQSSIDNGQGQGGIQQFISNSQHLGNSSENHMIKPQSSKGFKMGGIMSSSIGTAGKVAGDQSSKLKKKHITSNKNSNNFLIQAPIDQQRCSLQMKSKGSQERLSDANYIAKMSKKCNNLFLNNMSQGQFQIEQKLKSAASSPSLHSNHQHHNSAATNQPLKKKQQTIFDFGQSSSLTSGQHQKITQKKKSITGSNGITVNNNKVSVNSSGQLLAHKRSTSDGSSLTKMLNFKYQAVAGINQTKDALASKKESISYVASVAQKKQQLIKNVPSSSQAIQSQPNAASSNNNKIQSVSNMGSKRPSNEDDSIPYNSPRLFVQNQKLIVPTKDMYSEMKNFLTKFTQKNQNQIAGNVLVPPSKSNHQSMLSQANINTKPLTGGGVLSIATANSQNIQGGYSHSKLSSQNNKQQNNPIQGKNRLFRPATAISNSSSTNVNTQHHQQILNLEQPVEAKRQTLQAQSLKTLNGMHKRAKSDALQQFAIHQYEHQTIDNQSSKNTTTTTTVNNKVQNQPVQNTKITHDQKMFFLNLQMQQQLIDKQSVAASSSIHSQQNKNELKKQISQKMSKQQPQPIYSARQSPTNSRQIYYNFDDNCGGKQPKTVANGIPTARSEQQTAFKKVPSSSSAIQSNQTTAKKGEKTAIKKQHHQVATRGLDNPHPFLSEQKNNINYIPSSNINHQQSHHNQQNYNPNKQGADIYQKQQLQQLNQNSIDFTYDDYRDKQMLIFSSDNQQQVLTIQSKGSAYSDADTYKYNGNASLIIDENVCSISTLSKNILKDVQSMNQSPKIKIQPTPKVIQPGSTNTQLNLNDNNKLETFETNITNNDGLSPRSKDKSRLIKQIRLSFHKLNTPIKTTGEFYRIGKMLGKGAFGRVNLAIHKLSEQLAAVKSINKQFLNEDEEQKRKLMQEVLILQKTRHPNIVKLYDSFETNKHVVFVMELCAGGDLLNYVRKRRRIKEDMAKYVLKQVIEGLQYCHSKNIVHRDIKLDNLLFDDDGAVKICDFGVSKHLSSRDEVMNEQCGTPAYIAPEILRDKGYRGFGVDIWSLGVCLYAMLYGTVPFKANNMSDLHQLILKAKYSLKDDKVEISDDAKSLIRSLLEPDVSKRPTIQQVKKHKWLEEAYLENAFAELEIFNEAEKRAIQKDFTYQDMARFQRNKDPLAQQQNQDDIQQMRLQEQQQTTENFFTEHALDSTQNVLLKNNTTKSVVLAPFNSTRTHLASGELDEDGNAMFPSLDIDHDMIMDRKVIKYAPRVKDIDRQYVMNNNGEVDNGVYNKFVRQSTENAAVTSHSQDKSKIGKKGDLFSQDNSLVTSMNNQYLQNNLLPGGKIQCAAPLGTQNSDEEMEADLIKKNAALQNNPQSELNQIQHLLHLQQQTQLLTQTEEEANEVMEPQTLDYQVIEKVEQYGYPIDFIVKSLEQYEMNDATTSYYLLDRYNIKYQQYLEQYKEIDQQKH